MSDGRKTVRMYGLADKVERLAASGAYANEAEVIRDAVRRLPDTDTGTDTGDAHGDGDGTEAVVHE